MVIFALNKMCVNEQTQQYIVDGHHPYAFYANVPIGTSIIVSGYAPPSVKDTEFFPR